MMESFYIFHYNARSCQTTAPILSSPPGPEDELSTLFDIQKEVGSCLEILPFGKGQDGDTDP